MRYRLLSIMIALIMTISCVSGFHLSYAESADTADQLIEKKSEEVKKEKTKNYNRLLKASLKDVTINANINDAFDEEVELRVKPISPDANAKRVFEKQNINKEDVQGYDISFVNKEGKEIEPNKKVNISMTFNNNDQMTNKIIHINDEGKANIIKADVNKNKVSFKSDQFSDYWLASDDATKMIQELQNGNTVKLSHDVTIPADFSYKFLGKSCTLDLNGHTLTVNNNESTFVPKDNIRFTIMDSASSAQKGKITGDGTGEIIEVKNATVDLNGVKVENVVKFLRRNEGTVNIKDSTFTNCGRSDWDPVILSNGGTLNISNSTFTNNKGHNGGAVSVTGGSATLEGNTFTNNEATDGGALYINNASVTINSGTFSNNKATDTGWIQGGGAIYVTGDSANLTLQNESNNITFNQNFTAGSGGAIMANKVNLLTINGGTFTNNTSQNHEGGALSLGYGRATITKGVFTGNKTGFNEDGTAFTSYGDWGGGAIFCSDKGTMNFPTSVTDTNNTAEGFGGGLAGCSTARLYVFGDTNNGMAVYGNNALQQHASGENSTKNDDHTYGTENRVFLDGGSDDIVCFLSGYISNKMFGGSNANYTGTVDGNPYTATDQTDYITCSSVLGLKAQHSGGSNGAVQITGNISYTHGGGILNNGIMMFGSSQEIKQGTSVALTGNKALIDQDSNKKIAIDQNNNFEFSVHKESETGDVVSVGKILPNKEGKMVADNNNNYSIKFNNKLIFNPDDFKNKTADRNGVYTFTYYLTENPVKDEFVKDNSVYQIQVHIHPVTVSDVVGNQSVTKTNYYVVSDNAFTVKKKNAKGQFEYITNNTSWGYNDGDSHVNDDKHSPYLRLGSNEGTFINTKKHQPSLTIKKKVAGDAGDKTKLFTFKITLMDAENKPIHQKIDSIDFNEKGEATIQLKDGESMSLNKLPYGTHYKIEETNGQGYTTTYDDGDGNGTLTEDKTVTVTNTKNFTPDTGISHQNNGLLGIAIIGVLMTIAMVVMRVMKIKHE